MVFGDEFINLFKNVILKNGLEQPNGGSLPAGARTFSDYKLCLSLFDKRLEVPKAFENEPFAKRITRRKNTIFTEAFGSFTNEIHYMSWEGKGLDYGEFKKVYDTGLNKIESDSRTFSRSFENRLSKSSKFKQLRGELVGRLRYLMLYVFMKRPFNHFADSCLACLYAGGIPCGWDGDYPEGNIICYWPHEEEPVFEDNPVYPWHAYMKGNSP